MAWDYDERYQNRLWEAFHFFKSNAANGAINESIAPGKLWRLAEIRFWTTSAFRSNEYLFVNISSGKGSSFGASLLSYLFSNSVAYRLIFSIPMDMLSDDQVIVKLTTASAVHIVGVEALGWAVVGSN